MLHTGKGFAGARFQQPLSRWHFHTFIIYDSSVGWGCHDTRRKAMPRVEEFMVAVDAVLLLLCPPDPSYV